MRTDLLRQFGPSTLPAEPHPGTLLLHIEASLRDLSNRSKRAAALGPGRKASS
jgi:hypothetical protein